MWSRQKRYNNPYELLKFRELREMKFEIVPYVGVGSLKFGMKREEIRKCFNDQFEECQKIPFSETVKDDFGCCHVFYKKQDTCQAIEFFQEANVFFKGKKIIGKPFLKIKAMFEAIDNSLGFSDTGFTSFKYGVEIYAPAELVGPVESVIVFDREYSNLILRNSITWQTESFMKAGAILRQFS